MSHLQGLDRLSLRVVPPAVRRESFALVYAGQMTTQGLGYAAAGAAAEHLPASTVIPLAAGCGLAVRLLAAAWMRR